MHNPPLFPKGKTIWGARRSFAKESILSAERSEGVRFGAERGGILKDTPVKKGERQLGGS